MEAGNDTSHDDKLFRYRSDAAYEPEITLDYDASYGIGITITDGYNPESCGLYLPPDQARELAEAILKALKEVGK